MHSRRVIVYICGVRFGFLLDWITFLVMSLFVCPPCSPPNINYPCRSFYLHLSLPSDKRRYSLLIPSWLRSLVFLLFFPPPPLQLMKLRGRDSTVRWIRLLKLIFVILILQIFLPLKGSVWWCSQSYIVETESLELRRLKAKVLTVGARVNSEMGSFDFNFHPK
ncbi:hypothetical protein DFP73DRAFT_552131 [Morchella snyderi]|nr:hypothetical protein DFP73DRAFT_552131 [Morchella snyderi]